MLDRGDTFVTSNFILDETFTLIRYRIGHPAAVRFADTVYRLIDMGLVRLVRVDESHEAAALDLFRQYADQKFSYTDCTSFAVMQALGLTQVFTGDHHFAVLGFLVTPPA